MNTHLILLYYLMLLMAGVGLIVVLSYSAINTKDRVLKALTLFFVSFTIWIIISILSRYLRLNLYTLYFEYFEMVSFVNLIGRVVTLISIIHLTHQLLSIPNSRWIMMVFGLVTAIGFVYRSVLNKPTIENTTKISFHSPDLLDVVSTLICLYSFCALIWFRKKIKNNRHRFLVKNIIIILILFLPAIILETYHLFTGSFRVASLIYLSFTVLFYLYLRRFHLNSTVQSIPFSEGESPPLDDLNISNREKEIMQLILKGYSNKDIAQELFISISTVKTHAYNLYKKTGVKNRFELISQFQPKFIEKQS